MKSKFKEWFEKQYGKPPSNKKMFELRMEILNITSQINVLKHELENLEAYETKYDAALKAWVVIK